MVTAVLDGGRVRAVPGLVEAHCPYCDQPVIAKCGQIIAWHFAHRADSSRCDWDRDETEWHLNWKSHAPVERCERLGSKEGKLARADVIADGVAIEFQSAYLDDAFRERREYVWDGSHPTLANILWVVDARHILNSSGNKLNRSPDQTSATLIWKHPSKWWRDCEGAVVLDIGAEELFLVTEVRTGEFLRMLGEVISADDLIEDIKGDQLRYLLRQRFEVVEGAVERPSYGGGRKIVDFEAVPHRQLEPSPPSGVKVLIFCRFCSWHWNPTSDVSVCPKCDT